MLSLMQFLTHKKLLAKKDAARKVFLEQQRIILAAQNEKKRNDTEKRIQVAPTDLISICLS